MESNDFKSLFGSVAKDHGFRKVHGGWCVEFISALVALNLQRSNYGNYFELNIKVFLGEAGHSVDDLNKKIKSMTGDIFRRQPEECRPAFDLDSSLSEGERKQILDKMFAGLISLIVESADSPARLLELREERGPGSGLAFMHALP